MPREIFDCPVDRVVRVIDGDTQELMLDRGWRTFQGITTRLEGIDTPERNTEAGRLITQVVDQWLKNVGGTKYRLRWLSSSLDMYGRSLGDFADKEHPAWTLTAYLMEHGLAKRFKIARTAWTDEELQQAEEAARAILAGK